MAEKTLNTRIQQKSDTDLNWNKSVYEYGKVWRLEDGLTLSANATYSTSFTVGDDSYTSLQIASTGSNLYFNSTLVYSNGTWTTDFENCVLTFTTKPTGDLLAWLSGNATQLPGEQKESPFIPLKGEVIHYSTSDKIKIGDGSSNVEELDFIGGDGGDGLLFDEVYNLTTLDSVLPIVNGGTGANTAAGARTALGLGSLATQNTVSIANGGTGGTTALTARANLGLGLLAIEDAAPIEKGGTGATTAAGARENLNLGIVAVENIVPVAKGGTGATTAAGARENLGIATVTTSADGLMLSTDKVKLNALPNFFLSTSDPTSSDGANGDVWIKYEA